MRKANCQTCGRPSSAPPGASTPGRRTKGPAAGLLAHQIFGLTDAFMLGAKPGIVMWILMGLITGLYLNLAPAHLGAGEPDPS
ncbi:MAG: hypothetical protein ACE5F6_20785 [Anaerolineae bacterium]